MGMGCTRYGGNRVCLEVSVEMVPEPNIDITQVVQVGVFGTHTEEDLHHVT